MKISYRILALVFVLLTPATLAGDNNNQTDTYAGNSAVNRVSTLGSAGGASPDPGRKEDGIIANGSGHGATPDPTVITSSQTLFCIQGICFKL